MAKEDTIEIEGKVLEIPTLVNNVKYSEKINRLTPFFI